MSFGRTEILCRANVERVCTRWRQLALMLPCSVRFDLSELRPGGPASEEWGEEQAEALEDALSIRIVDTLKVRGEAYYNRHMLPPSLDFSALRRLCCHASLAGELLPTCTALERLELATNTRDANIVSGSFADWEWVCRQVVNATRGAPPTLRKLRVSTRMPFFKQPAALLNLDVYDATVEATWAEWQALLAACPSERAARDAHAAHGMLMLGATRRLCLHASSPRRLAKPLPNVAAALPQLETLRVEVSSLKLELDSSSDEEREWFDDEWCGFGHHPIDRQDLSIPWLAALPSLQDLTVRAEETPTIYALPDVWGLTQLTALEIDVDAAAPPLPAQLALPALRRLKLHAFFEDQALPAVLCSLTGLTRLVVAELPAPFTRHFRLAPEMSQLTNLQELWLNLEYRQEEQAKGLHPSSLAALRTLRSLHTLQLRGCMLQALPRSLPLRGLTALDIAGNAFARPDALQEPAVLTWLERCTALQALTLGTGGPRRLRLTEDEAQAEAGASLASLERLRLVQLIWAPSWRSGDESEEEEEEEEEEYSQVLYNTAGALADAGVAEDVALICLKAELNRHGGTEERCPLRLLPFAEPLGDALREASGNPFAAMAQGGLCTLM